MFTDIVFHDCSPNVDAFSGNSNLGNIFTLELALKSNVPLNHVSLLNSDNTNTLFRIGALLCQWREADLYPNPCPEEVGGA